MQNLSIGQPAAAASDSRNKVALKPGYSLMDWIRKTNSGVDLIGCQPHVVTLDELALHQSEDDCWIALHNKVYNVTAYMKYHPGGIDELLSGGGCDSTELFNSTHSWVNFESMLKKCYIGPLSTSTTSLSNQEDKPDFAIPKPVSLPKQTKKQDNITFSWKDEGAKFSIIHKFIDNLSHDNVQYYVSNRLVRLVVLLADSRVYQFEVEPNGNLNLTTLNFTVTSNELKTTFSKLIPSGKVLTPGAISKDAVFLMDEVLVRSELTAKIVDIQSHTHDTNVYTLSFSQGSKLLCPIGKHFFLSCEVASMTISRPYTPIANCSELNPPCHSNTFKFLIKLYPQGVYTSYLSEKVVGNTIILSYPIGIFDVATLDNFSFVLCLAAGTGITPMVNLIQYALSKLSAKICLLFFNKTEKDILLADLWQTLTAAYGDRFALLNVLSQPSSDWSGLTGRISDELLISSLPLVSCLTNCDYTSDCFVAVCGPNGFMSGCEAALRTSLHVPDHNVHMFKG